MKMPRFIRGAFGQTRMDPFRSSTLKKTLESIAFPVLAIVLLRMWPGVHFHYPWWWLVPLAIALRYGLLHGLGSGLTLIVCQFIAIRLFGSAWSLPPDVTVGGLIATYLAGLYASHSQNRLIEANARLGYLEERLESLTRVFYVTRLSHSRLEENLITKSNNLRSGLAAIAEEIEGQDLSGAELPPEPLQHMLQLLAFYGRIGTSGVFAIVNGRATSKPLAHIGRRFELSVNDALITGMLDSEGPAYYSVDQILAGQTSNYRVVLPMKAADGSMLALVVIADLPLLAIEEENLLTLAAMTAYVTDALRARQISHPVRDALPDCPADMALNWRRLGHLNRSANVRSSWVRLRPQENFSTGVVEVIKSARRGLDSYWFNPTGLPEHSILVLLPLAGPGAVRGFLDRIDALCRQHLDLPLDALGWRAEHAVIQSGSATELRNVLRTDGKP